MRKKRMMALLLTGVILAGMITGCGNQQTETPEAKETETAQEQAAEEAPPQEESGGENVNLRFCWWGSDTRHEKTLEALAKYEEMTGVHIEGEYSTISSYYEKLVTQLAGGTAPDIIQLDYPWITELAAQGDFFVNLEDYDIIDFGKFDMDYTKGWCSEGDKLAALPMAQNGFTLFFNRNVAKETGISIDENTEWSWEDLIAEGEKFKAANPDKVFLHSDLHTLEKNVFKPYVLQQCGGQWINDDFTVNFTKEQLANAYAYLLELEEKDLIQPLEETMAYNGNIDQNPIWANGEAALLIRWASDYPSLINDNVQDIGCCRLPVIEGATDTGINCKPSMVLAINKDSVSVEECLKFANWMMTDEEAIRILGDCRGVPATAEARGILEENDLLNPDLKTGIEIASANAGTAQNGYHDNSEITSISTEILSRVLYKDLTPEEAAEEFLNTIQDPLATLAGN
ncbi:ABC transporter substrate-binding protein [Lachnospiraceae bacterium 38-10]